jgi:hypothetical protein
MVRRPRLISLQSARNHVGVADSYIVDNLPAALECAAVHVQHLTRNVARPGKVNHCFGDVGDAGDCSHGRECLQKSLDWFVCMGVSTMRSATALKRMCCFAYSIARLRVAASMPPLVIIATGPGAPAIGLSTVEAVMLTMLPPVFCASVCFTTRCVR